MSETNLKTKKVTLNSISDKIDKLSDTVESLAISTARGFNDMHERFERVDKRFEKVDTRFDSVEQRLGLLENGQDELKLRLDGVAYSFEVVDLKKRVLKLEQKTGII